MRITLLALLAALSLALTTHTATADSTGDEEPTAVRERILFDFRADDADAWPSLNDGVMGGVSRGGARITGGRMVFTGETRLENNGGFSSIRTRGTRADLTGYDELLVRMKANADRKYVFVLQAEAEGARGGISYWQKFSVLGDGYQTVSLPLGDFYPTFRGSKLRGFPLQKDRIRSFGLMVYDGKAGAFRMEVEWIKAAGQPEASLAKAPRATATKSEAKKRGGSIVDVAAGAGDFETLLAAAGAAGLADTLASKGPFTVLAPSDNAFAALPAETLQSLLRPENKDRLRQILLFHVLPGKLSAKELLASGINATAQGQDLDFSIREGRFNAGGAFVIANDLQATNGVIHVIDRVLIPDLPEANPILTLLEKAAEQGAPLYNEGQPAACAALYEMTVRAILTLAGDDVPVREREMLRDALSTAEKAEDRREAAWALRRAMDATYEVISD